MSVLKLQWLWLKMDATVGHLTPVGYLFVKFLLYKTVLEIFELMRGRIQGRNESHEVAAFHWFYLTCGVKEAYEWHLWRLAFTEFAVNSSDEEVLCSVPLHPRTKELVIGPFITNMWWTLFVRWQLAWSPDTVGSIDTSETTGWGCCGRHFPACHLVFELVFLQQFDCISAEACRNQAGTPLKSKWVSLVISFARLWFCRGFYFHRALSTVFAMSTPAAPAHVRQNVYWLHHATYSSSSFKAVGSESADEDLDIIINWSVYDSTVNGTWDWFPLATATP